MKTADAIAAVKAAGHDISEEYSKEDCLGFLNTAVTEVAGLLIAGNAAAMVHEITMHDGEKLPDRFVKSAGQYPVRITGDEVTFLSPEDDTGIRFRYFATPAPMEDETGNLPFTHDALNDYVVKAAALLALNRNEYDISQDKALYDELRQIIGGAIGIGG